MATALDRTFAALADPTRRAILARLARGESSVTGLAAPFRMSLPAVSKHLRVLEHAGLIQRTKQGRVHRLRLSPEPLRDAGEWIDFYRQFWEGQFDALARYLDQTTDKETGTWPSPKPGTKRSSSSGAPSRPRGNGSSPPGRKKKR